jgi:hypothetical protein
VQATFYEHKVFGKPNACGVVTVENGVAFIPTELDFIKNVSIIQPDTLKILTPADGDAYVQALSATFDNGYFWATVGS